MSSLVSKIVEKRDHVRVTNDIDLGVTLQLRLNYTIMLSKSIIKAIVSVLYSFKRCAIFIVKTASLDVVSR